MESTNRLSHIISNLLQHWKIWVATLMLGVLAAGIYAFFIKQDSWTARQSLIIRDDLLGSPFKPGRFESLETMKSAQETVLEVARRPQVIRRTLEKLGPQSSFLGKGGSADWPSEKVIEEIQGDISLGAPNGNEFGKTETIVLGAKSSERGRAIEFITLLLDEIDVKLSEVRQAKLNSMVEELEQGKIAANATMDEAASRLKIMEANLGPDINTMRSMNEPRSGTSAFDTKLNQIRTEKRLAEAKLASALKQRELMQQAQSNPSIDLVTSSEMLALQPAFASLVKGLGDAQLVEAKLLGDYHPSHPKVQSARETVRASKQNLYYSLGPAIAGIDSQIRVFQDNVNRLDNLLAGLEARLRSLTEQRVSYSTLEQEVNKKREFFNTAQAKLAEMNSLAKSAASTALLTRVDSPQVPTRPDGLGKKAIGMAGAIGGLLLGLGLVMLIAPPFQDPQRDQAAVSRPAAPSTGAAPESSVPPQSRTQSRLDAIAASTAGRAAKANQSQQPATVPMSELIASKLEDHKNAQFVENQKRPEVVVNTPPAGTQPSIADLAKQTRPEVVVTPPAESNQPTAPADSAGISASIAALGMAASTNVAAPIVAAAKAASSRELQGADDQISPAGENHATSEQVADQINQLAKDLEEATKTKPTTRESAPTIQTETQDAIEAAGALPIRRRSNQRPAEMVKANTESPTTQEAIDNAFGIASAQDQQPATTKVEPRPNPFLKNDAPRANPFGSNPRSDVESAATPVAPPQTQVSNPFAGSSRADVQSAAAPTSAAPDNSGNNPFADSPRAAVQSAPEVEPSASASVPQFGARKDLESAQPVKEPKPEVPGALKDTSAKQEFEKADPSVQMPPLGGTLPIPAQLRQLSDSILSFAQPADE